MYVIKYRANKGKSIVSKTATSLQQPCNFFCPQGDRYREVQLYTVTGTLREEDRARRAK